MKPSCWLVAHLYHKENRVASQSRRDKNIFYVLCWLYQYPIISPSRCGKRHMFAGWNPIYSWLVSPQQRLRPGRCPWANTIAWRRPFRVSALGDSWRFPCFLDFCLVRHGGERKWPHTHTHTPARAHAAKWCSICDFTWHCPAHWLMAASSTAQVSDSLLKLLLQHSSLKFSIYRAGGSVDISLCSLTPGFRIPVRLGASYMPSQG